MRNIVIQRGYDYESVRRAVVVKGDNNSLSGAMGSVLKFLMGHDFFNEFILPENCSRNELYYTHSDFIGVRLFECEARLELRGYNLNCTLRLQDNANLDKFRTDVTISYGSLLEAKRLNSVMSNTDLDKIAIRFTTDSKLELTADGFTGLCNLFNFLASYKESITSDSIRICRHFDIKGLV